MVTENAKRRAYLVKQGLFGAETVEYLTEAEATRRDAVPLDESRPRR